MSGSNSIGRATVLYPEVGSSSLSRDFLDLVDLVDFRYCVPHCSHSYINIIEILI